MRRSISAYLPHHRLRAYSVALELLAAVKVANITNKKLKDEALRAAKGACLNIAEGCGARLSRRQGSRRYSSAWSTFLRAPGCKPKS